MKKIIVCIMSITLVLGLTACGGSGGASGTQGISFQGINMEIPAAWKVEDKTLSDDNAVYEKLNKTGHDYRLVFTDTTSLFETDDMDLNASSFKEATEADSRYTDVSDPVAGKLGDKYDMHIIDCTYHAINVKEDDKESDYPCKLVKVYMDGHKVTIEFSTAEGDFEAFDTALENATCE